MKRIILGKFNGLDEVYYWELGLYECEIGDFAVVENKKGFDLVEIVGIAEVSDMFKHGNKKVICTFTHRLIKESQRNLYNEHMNEENEERIIITKFEHELLERLKSKYIHVRVSDNNFVQLHAGEVSSTLGICDLLSSLAGLGTLNIENVLANCEVIE